MIKAGKLIKTVLAFSALALLTAGSAGAASDLAYIQIQNGVSLTIAAGLSKGVSVVGYASDGRVLTGVPSVEDVEWTSSNSSVAYVERTYDEELKVFTDRLKAVSPGKAEITATTLFKAADDDYAEDTLAVTVVEKMKYMSIDPAVWDQLYDFNSRLSASDMALDFVDADPGLIGDENFRREFEKAWKTAPAQITDLNTHGLSFESRGNPPAGDWKTARSGLFVSAAGAEHGQLLPVKYIWNYSWDELSRILGGTVSENPGVQRLFKLLKLDFYSVGGSSGSSTQYTVIGQGGVSASDAAAVSNVTPPLDVKSTGTGVSVELTVYLANVPSSSGPKLINGLLVVPDGAADNYAAGTMWMLEGAASGSGGSASGGGGCVSVFVSPVMLAALVFLKPRKQ